MERRRSRTRTSRAKVEPLPGGEAAGPSPGEQARAACQRYWDPTTASHDLVEVARVCQGLDPKQMGTLEVWLAAHAGSGPTGERVRELRQLVRGMIEAIVDERLSRRLGSEGG